MNTLLGYGWAWSPSRIALAAVITAAFAVIAFALRGVSRPGAIAGGVACLLLFLCAGPAAFITLVGLFLLTWAATRFGFRRKQQLGLAERREGRNASQVLANLGVAATCSVLFALAGNPRWLLALTAGLAEAASDTVASEIGQTSKGSSLLITNWKPVPSGTDGGITLIGTLAGTAAALIVSLVAAFAGMIIPRQLWIPVVCGVFGMLADSVMGATLQRRGWINNNGVNLLGTAAAAALAIALWRS